MLNFIKKVPLFVYLLLIVVAVFLYGDLIPLRYKEILLALSEMMKDLLVVFLPIIIFSCLFSSMLSFKDRAILFVAGFLIFVCISNYMTSLLGFGIGVFASHFLDNMAQTVTVAKRTLQPAWDLSMQEWIDNRYALGLGLIGGLIAAYFPNRIVQKLAEQLNVGVHFFLKKIFLPLMPIFVFGFVVKMEYEGLLEQIFKTYLPILMIITAGFVVYIFILFFVAAKFNFRETFLYIRRASPAGILGFSTLSSMAALPLNLEAAERNSPNPCAARAIVPATVNNHLIGDSLAVPIIAVAVLLTFNMPLPGFLTFSVFAIFLMLTKFSIVAVPAGGIIVVLAPLSTYLGFSGEMVALLLAVYLLFEPVITAANVMGNNAIAILLSRITGKLTD